MQMVCPRCHSTLDVEQVDTQLPVVCASCGSSICLAPQATTGWLPTDAPQRLGKFDFLERLGVGSFGTVYKARDTELDRVVAIKVPRTGSLPDQKDLDRFL